MQPIPLASERPHNELDIDCYPETFEAFTARILEENPKRLSRNFVLFIMHKYNKQCEEDQQLEIYNLKESDEHFVDQLEQYDSETSLFKDATTAIDDVRDMIEGPYGSSISPSVKERNCGRLFTSSTYLIDAGHDIAEQRELIVQAISDVEPCSSVVNNQKLNVMIAYHLSTQALIDYRHEVCGLRTGMWGTNHMQALKQELEQSEESTLANLRDVDFHNSGLEDVVDLIIWELEICRYNIETMRKTLKSQLESYVDALEEYSQQQTSEEMLERFSDTPCKVKNNGAFLPFMGGKLIDGRLLSALQVLVELAKNKPDVQISDEPALPWDEMREWGYTGYTAVLTRLYCCLVKSWCAEVDYDILTLARIAIKVNIQGIADLAATTLRRRLR